LLCEERDYSASLGSAGELYGGPLTKLSSLTADEHFLLFGGLADLAAVSKQLCSQVSSGVYFEFFSTAFTNGNDMLPSTVYVTGNTGSNITN
jgi:hypothetical protein